MSAITSVQAYAIATRALPIALGREVEPSEIWAVLAVARVESGYGSGWTSPPHAPDMVGSRNWGAIQCVEHGALFRLLGTTDYERAKEAMREYSVPSAVAGHCAMTLDWLPGKGWFAHPYRCYASHDEACGALGKQLDGSGVLDAVREQPDTWTLAAAMFDAHYYTGKSGKRDVEVPIRARQLADAVRGIAERLGGSVTPPLALVEAAPDGGGGFRPDPLAGGGGRSHLDAIRLALAVKLTATLELRRPFLCSDEVRALQEDLNHRGARLEIDGVLGPRTLAAWLSDPRELEP
jgi:hypothetical protein